MIKFEAHKGVIRTDEHGETKVTFIVPLSELKNVIGINLLVDQMFVVTVMPKTPDHLLDSGSDD